MSGYLLPLALFGTSLGLFASSASAVSIAPVAQDRSFEEVHFDPSGNRFVTTTTAPDFQDFSADFGASVGHHFSSIGTDVITGDLFSRGRALLSGPNEELYDRESAFGVDFDLVELADYVLDGVFDTDAQFIGSDSFGRLSLSVFDVGLGSFVPFEFWHLDGDDTGSSPLPVSGVGVLAPGSYRLEAIAKASGTIAGDSSFDSFANVDFTLTLSTVPEPTTAPLFALAVLAASAAGSRRRR